MTEVIVRACGHSVEFAPTGDQYDEARRKKLREKRCPDCGRVKNEQDNARQNGKVKKGQELKLVPAGTIVAMIRRDDGTWEGSIRHGGTVIDGTMGGAMGLMNKLARKFLQTGGAKLTGKVAE